MPLHFFTHLIVAASIVVASSAWAADYISPTPWSSLVSSDIKRFLPSDEIRPLLASEAEFISLHRESMAASQRGVVLIIPDWQHTPTNNAGINFLRTELNDLGYATLAMTIPDIDWQTPDIKKAAEDNDQAATTEPTQASEPEPATNEQISEQTNTSPSQQHVSGKALINDAVIDNYKVNLITRFNALYDSALDEQGKIVVIAQGTSGALLLEHYANFPSTNIDAFISLSSYLPIAERNKKLNASLTTISPPLLDVYYSVDNPNLLHSVTMRQKWAKRHNKYDYRQRELFGLPNEPRQHQRLAKEVDGFLRRLF